MDGTEVPDLGKQARQAYAFMQTEYGSSLVQRMVGLHSSLTQQAENAPTLEQRGLLITEAAGLKQGLDLILKDAQLVESGELERMEEREKLETIREDGLSSITP